MATGIRCMSCMYGTIVNGVCSHCGRTESAPNPNALPAGTLLHGRYYIGNVLGQGGFGITYAAWDRNENRRVAIKELYPSSDVVRGSDRCTMQVRRGQEQYFAKVYSCFEGEAKTLMRLQGLEGVVSLYHLFSDNNTIYYAMEYLDGMDFSTFLRKNGPMQWDMLAPIADTLLTALGRLHEEGVIHRDVSPDNIFMVREGAPRLIDFGSVRAYQGINHFTAFIKKNFAPWEQYQTEGEQGPWTDIYAFCVTLYYALSGQLPPMASDRRQQDTVIPLYQLCPRLPAHVSGAVMCGMAVGAKERCRSTGELKRMLFPEESSGTSGGRGPQQAAARKQSWGQQNQQVLCLVCGNGIYKGKQWQLQPGRYYRIGRQQNCEIPYPERTQGVSRLQCTVCVDGNGRALVRDEKSSFGTYMNTIHGKVRLAPNQWYLLNGCPILFGQQEQYFVQ